MMGIVEGVLGIEELSSNIITNTSTCGNNGFRNRIGNFGPEKIPGR